MSDCTEASFLKDVAEHQIEIIRDDGVHRHVRFKKPGTACYYFDMITWPGCLCYTGDMGTYVFSRIEDMFEFFRMNKSDWNYNKKGGLSINPGYWSEKLIAVDGNRRHGGAEEFDSDRFRETIRDLRLEWIKENRDRTTKSERRELWDEIEHEVLFTADDGEHECMRAAYDFSWSGKNCRFTFGEFWEHRFTRFTYHFMWCCYALAWAVKKYDEHAPQRPLSEDGAQSSAVACPTGESK